MAQSFQTWVDRNGGIDATARLLDVSEQVVKRWYRIQGTPKIATMRRMIALSKGALSYASIIASTDPKGA